MDYPEFLIRKAMIDPMTGLDRIPALPDCLFPHQRDIVTWALRRGRAALFAGTGLGKSLMELAWAQAIKQETGKDILLLAPLAVSAQMQREGEKFGIAANLVAKQSDCQPGTNITNYQKLDHMDLSRFGGVILDESSILKSTNGHYRTQLIEACQSIPFRLAATATPAPNDFMELGNHAEFLGIMKYTDMLATFFTHDGGDTAKWRIKGHAENEFWKWMASWAVMLRKPSDLGYSNDGYDLPPLNFVSHTVSVDYAPNMETGTLFPMQAETLQERIKARRATVESRTNLALSVVTADLWAKLPECHGNPNTKLTDSQKLRLIQNTLRASRPSALVLELGSPNTTQCSPHNPASAQYVGAAPAKSGNAGSQSTTATTTGLSEDCSATSATKGSEGSETDATCLNEQSNISTSPLDQWVIWCQLNSEQDALRRAFGDLCFSVSGSDNEEDKERSILGWLAGERPILLSKPTICGFGLNFQCCHKTLFVGLNDSFEQFYQAVRRFWRFGQSKPVTAHIVASELEGATVANIRRKEADADRMAAAMVMHMADLSSDAVRGSVRDTPTYNPQFFVQLPAFMDAA